MIRSVSASAGVDWLKNAINLGRGNPRALFGGAALAVVAMVVLMFALGIVQGLLLAGFGSAGAMVAGMAVTMVAVVVVISMLLVGFLRLVDDVENGRPTSAGRVFAGFGDLGASLRVIGFTLVLTLLQYAVLGLLLAVLARDALGWYARMMTMSDPTTMDPAMLALPDGIALAMVVTVVVGLVMYAVQAIGACQIALKGRGVFGAVGDGLSGTFRNLLPLVVLLLVVIAAAIAVAIVAGILALVVGMLAKLAGAWLGLALGVPLYLAFMLVLWVVGIGIAYHLWRDICGGADDAPLPVEAASVGA